MATHQMHSPINFVSLGQQKIKRVIRPIKHISFILLITLIIGWKPTTAAQVQGTTVLISVNNQGEPGNQDSTLGKISSDGRFIAYASNAENLDQHEIHSDPGVYIHDRSKEISTWISTHPNLNAEKEYQFIPVISGNGRFIFYEVQTNSPAGNHKTNQSNSYVYDQLTGKASPLRLPGREDSLGLHQLNADYEGRYLAFSDFNHQRDGESPESLGLSIILDRLNQRLIIPEISSSQDHAANFGNSLTPQISGDGRFLVSFSMGPDSTAGDPMGITLYNRVLDSIQTFPTSIVSRSLSGELDPPQITHNGGTLAFLSYVQGQSSDLTEISIMDVKTSIVHLLKTEGNPISYKLTSNGNRIAYTSHSDDSSINLFIIDLETETTTKIADDILILGDISADGGTVVYTKMIKGFSQVMVWEETGHSGADRYLAGQVSDTTGHPLSLVTITDGWGNANRTDGNGFFWLSGIRSGSISLVPDKEGFRFDPKVINLDVFEDSTSINFTYAHEDVLNEARLDIGMPYNFDRNGDGAFHGFTAGYCTDLVLDAYSWGVDFNIQFALEQDFRADPRHFYRWRDARNAHDMWRYFLYSNQLQPHTNPYQPGDIVFFDWSEDGEIDHVALVSEVNSKHRPRKMMDATGVINSNPGGLTAELPWEDFHELTVRGFARWSGRYQPVIPDMPADPVFQLALGGTGLVLWLVGPQGDIISPFQSEIPGGEYYASNWEKYISIMNPAEPTVLYQVRLFNPGLISQPYQLTSQFIQGGLVNARYETKGNIEPGEIKHYPLFLDTNYSPVDQIVLRNSIKRNEGFIKN